MDSILPKEIKNGSQHRDGQFVAIKCVNLKLEIYNQKAFELFQSEQQYLAKVNNDNVVKFIEYFEVDETGFLVLQFCNEGDLEQHVKTFDKQRVPENKAIIYFKQLLNGLKALHDILIIHRDLKLANILIHDGKIKIADLGFSKMLNQSRDVTETQCGTPYNMAPEILKSEKYSFEADIYSLGIIFFQLLYGQYPFKSKTQYQLIKEQQNLINFDIPDVNVSQELKNLIQEMLAYDPKKRIERQKLYDHQLFRNNTLQQFNIKQLQTQQMKQSNLQNSKIQMEQKSQLYQQKQNIETFYNKDQMIQEYMKFYLNEFNILQNLETVIYKAYQLPENNINTFYPVYLLWKKLYNMYLQNIQQIEQKQNTFNLQYYQILFQSELLKNYKIQLQEKKEIIMIYLQSSQLDVENLMQQTPDPIILDELQQQITDPILFKQILTNYCFDLQYCVNNNLGRDQDEFSEHLLDILDIINFDQTFRQTQIFDFQEYYKQKKSVDKRQQLIEQGIQMIL